MTPSWMEPSAGWSRLLLASTTSEQSCLALACLPPPCLHPRHIYDATYLQMMPIMAVGSPQALVPPKSRCGQAHWQTAENDDINDLDLNSLLSPTQLNGLPPSSHHTPWSRRVIAQLCRDQSSHLWLDDESSGFENYGLPVQLYCLWYSVAFGLRPWSEFHRFRIRSNDLRWEIVCARVTQRLGLKTLNLR